MQSASLVGLILRPRFSAARWGKRSTYCDNETNGAQAPSNPVQAGKTLLQRSHLRICLSRLRRSANVEIENHDQITDDFQRRSEEGMLYPAGSSFDFESFLSIKRTNTMNLLASKINVATISATPNVKHSIGKLPKLKSNLSAKRSSDASNASGCVRRR